MISEVSCHHSVAALTDSPPPIDNEQIGLIDLQLLGGLAADGKGLAPAPVSHRHPLALLALLAAAAPRPVGREKLMAFLWPESDSGRASNSLRQTIFRLRRDLGEDVFLPESAAGLRLDPRTLAVDLWAFREALERDALEEAVRVYRGPFLDGFGIPHAAEFARWVEAERDRLAQQHLGALDALAGRAGEEGRHQEAVSWRRRQAAADPFSSRVALALLKALVAAGDRPGALQYASVYENIVRHHLDTEPDPAVTEFVSSRVRDRSESGSPRTPKQGRLPPAPVEPPTWMTPAPTDASPATAPPTPIGRSFFDRRLWLVAVAAVVLTVGVGRLMTARSATQGGVLDDSTVVVLASGAKREAGRDPANRLIACNGPACPAGGLPQHAYSVPPLGSYGPSVAGSGYIAPVPDATIQAAPGYPCCTTATFENQFSLPSNAATARISVSLLADDQATVTINDVEFGRHADGDADANSGGPVETFSTTFRPDPEGTNRLHVTLSDGGGALGLHYHAVVTYETLPRHDNVCGHNVAEAARYALVYALSIPKDANYQNGLPPYTADHSETVGAFDRVAYCLQLDDDWVWVSMDAFTDVPIQLGVPVSATGATFQRKVADMNVFSNVPGVITGTGIPTGNIEFWHQCYDETTSVGFPGGSSTLNDFDDVYPHPRYEYPSCYGSMQVHDYGAQQTVFAYNQWDRDPEFNTGPDDLGIGNSPVGIHPDWTFEGNAASYTVRTLHVLVRPAARPGPR